MIRKLVLSIFVVLATASSVAMAQDFAGQTTASAAFNATKSLLQTKSPGSKAYLKLSQRKDREKLGLKPKITKSTSKLAPKIKSASPASPVQFSELTTNQANEYVLILNGENFSKDMTVRVRRPQENNTLQYISYKYISPKKIQVRIAERNSSLIIFSVIKSVGSKAQASNALPVTFNDDLPGGDVGGGTPPDLSTPTPTSPPSSGVPPGTPTPGATPTATPTPPPITSQPGDHVAALELGANGHQKFVLRSVMPIPPGKLKVSEINSGLSLFAVEDADGTLQPAQLETVTKSGGDYLGDPNPDVEQVEVIAQVKIRSGQTRPQYRVIEASSLQPQRPSTGYTARSVLGAPPFGADGSILSLFNTAGKIKLRGRDIFGNLYSADLTEQVEGLPVINKYGAYQVQVRTFNIMTPDTVVAGSQGTYPRMFNVHAYFTVERETKALKLELKIGSTVAGLNKNVNDDNFIKELYFKDLFLEIDGANWGIEYDTPSAYSANPVTVGSKTNIALITPLSNGKSHYLPALKHYLFRTALYPPLSGAQTDALKFVREEGLAFAIPGTSSNNPQLELFSYFNPQLSSYLNHGMFVPTLNHISGGAQAARNKYNADLNQFTTLVANDQCYATSTIQNGVQSWSCNYPKVCGYNPQDPNDPSDQPCGPLQAMGVTYGGMTSGSELDKSEGALVAGSASTEGYRWLVLQHKLRTQRNDQFHLRSGEAVSLADLETSSSCGTVVPVDYFNKLNTAQLDPWGANQSPVFQTTYAQSAALKPAYDFYWNPLLSSAFQNEDGQHIVRMTRTIDALIYLGNDSIAKDDALATASVSMMQHPHLPTKCSGTSPVQDNDGLIPMTPNAAGVGVSLGREHAHMWNAMVTAYAVGSHSWRQYVRAPFFDYYIDNIISVAQMPSLGFVLRNNNFAKSSPIGRCWVVPINEESFHVVTNLAIRRKVYSHADVSRTNLLQQIITNQVYGMLTPALAWADGIGTNVPNWSSTRFRVPIAAELQPGNIFSSWDQVPLACQNDSNTMGPNYAEFLLGFAQVRQWTGDTVFSVAASKKLNPSSTNTLLSKLQGISHYTLEEGNHVPLLACAQRGRC